jgi:hypothetical protein
MYGGAAAVFIHLAKQVEHQEVRRSSDLDDRIAAQQLPGVLDADAMHLDRYQILCL